LKDQSIWLPTTLRCSLGENQPTTWEVSAMRQPLIWIAVALMLTGAILLVTDVGVAGLWIAVITVGIALVAVEAYRNRQGHHHV
jgi:hypothetical protein